MFSSTKSFLWYCRYASFFNLTLAIEAYLQGPVVHYVVSAVLPVQLNEFFEVRDMLEEGRLISLH
jgi:hypothetical protein